MSEEELADVLKPPKLLCSKPYIDRWQTTPGYNKPDLGKTFCGAYCPGCEEFKKGGWEKVVIGLLGEILPALQLYQLEYLLKRAEEFKTNTEALQSTGYSPVKPAGWFEGE